MKKWLVLLIVVILGIASFLDWQDWKETKYVANVLDSIPIIERVSVIDASTGKKLFELTKTDLSFWETVNVFELPYVNLKWSEKKLMKQNPFFVVEYFKGDDVLYKANIYKLQNKYNYVLDGKRVSNEQRTYEYTYSPLEDESPYFFALDEYDKILGVNEGLKEVLNKVLVR